jgi:hypothetical protein
MAGRAGAIPVIGRASICDEALLPGLLRLARREAASAPDLARGLKQGLAAVLRAVVPEWGRALLQAARPEAQVQAAQVQAAVVPAAAIRCVAVVRQAAAMAAAAQAANADECSGTGTSLRAGTAKG